MAELERVKLASEKIAKDVDDDNSDHEDLNDTLLKSLTFVEFENIDKNAELPENMPPNTEVLNRYINILPNMVIVFDF